MNNGERSISFEHPKINSSKSGIGLPVLEVLYNKIMELGKKDSSLSIKDEVNNYSMKVLVVVWEYFEYVSKHNLEIDNQKYIKEKEKIIELCSLGRSKKLDFEFIKDGKISLKKVLFLFPIAYSVFIDTNLTQKNCLVYICSWLEEKFNFIITPDALKRLTWDFGNNEWLGNDPYYSILEKNRNKNVFEEPKDYRKYLFHEFMENIVINRNSIVAMKHIRHYPNSTETVYTDSCTNQFQLTYNLHKFPRRLINLFRQNKFRIPIIISIIIIAGLIIGSKYIFHKIPFFESEYIFVKTISPLDIQIAKKSISERVSSEKSYQIDGVPQLRTFFLSDHFLLSIEGQDGGIYCVFESGENILFENCNGIEISGEGFSISKYKINPGSITFNKNKKTDFINPVKLSWYPLTLSGKDWNDIKKIMVRHDFEVFSKFYKSVDEGYQVNIEMIDEDSSASKAFEDLFDKYLNLPKNSFKLSPFTVDEGDKYIISMEAGDWTSVLTKLQLRGISK